MTNSPYYKDTGKIALASKISVQFRKKMFDKFMETLKPSRQHAVLDIGVTSDDSYQESNYFERFYPYKDQIVCVGTEDGSHLEKKYPGIKFFQINPHEALPFKNNEFDIAFSNAVIEHVGSWEMQRAFLLEMLKPSPLLVRLYPQFLGCALVALRQAIMVRIGTRTFCSFTGGGILRFVGTHLCACGKETEHGQDQELLSYCRFHDSDESKRIESDAILS